MELMIEKKKGFKKTEVGMIPYDWVVEILDNLSTITRLAGAEYSSVWEEDQFGEIIALRGFNIGKNKIIEKDFARISNTLSQQLKRSRLKKGDVIYPCVGSIGNAVVIHENDKYHIQQNIARIIPNDKVDSTYMAYFLMSPLGLNEVDRFNATSSQPNVLVGSLRQYRMPLPPNLAEQQAIATALSDVDELIRSLDGLIQKKEAIKKGTMQQLLSGKKRLPGFDGEWELKALGDVLLSSPDYGINAPATDYNSNYPTYLRITDISEEGNFIHSGKKSVNAISSDMYFLSEGEIVLARTGASTGKSYLYNPKDGELVFAGFLIRIKPNPQKTISQFLKYYLQTDEYWNWVEKNSMRSGQPGLNSVQYSSLQILFPSVVEQKAIAQILTDMDREIQILRRKREKVGQIKQGMMQELLTGRVRLV